MPEEIQVGDQVQLWLEVTDVLGDSVTVAGLVTTGKESITGHRSKQSPDEVWARMTIEEKRALLERR